MYSNNKRSVGNDNENRLPRFFIITVLVSRAPEYWIKRGPGNELGMKEAIVWFSFDPGRVNSISRALDCRTGGRGFDSYGQTNTRVLKITEQVGCAFALETVRGPSRGS